MSRVACRVLLVALVAFALPVAASTHAERVRTVIDASVKDWFADPELIALLKEQNRRHAPLEPAAIAKIDRLWREQARSDSRPLIDAVHANRLSWSLRSLLEASDGLYREICIVDNKGLVAGHSDVSPDYWQGAKPGWRYTVLSGAREIFVDEIVAVGESGAYVPAAAPIVDPATQEIIGALIVSVDLERVEQTAGARLRARAP